MQEKDKNTQRRNQKKYKTYIFRVRHDSELAQLLAEHGESGETSVNFLITAALCNYFKCRIPHREYNRMKRKRII